MLSNTGWGIKERVRKAWIPRLVNLIANPSSVGGPKEDSTLSNAPWALSDEE